MNIPMQCYVNHSYRGCLSENRLSGPTLFRFSGSSEVRVRAQVMMRDDSTGGWVPMGGGGLSNVSVRRRKLHHQEDFDQPCRHEYLIHGKRISDNSVRFFFHPLLKLSTYLYVCLRDGALRIFPNCYAATGN